MIRIAAALGFVLVAAAAHAQALPSIDWGKAGQGEPEVKVPQLPEDKKSAASDSGFDCRTEMRMAMEEPDFRSRRDVREWPREVKRCSRDGFSIEMGPSSN